jgi:Flp pilus assembly pilin Flp
MLRRTYLKARRAISRCIWRTWSWSSTARLQLRPDGGQTVAEYALVLLVVAAIAVAFLVWARQSGRLDAFFDAIFEKLLNSVEPDATPQP